MDENFNSIGKKPTPLPFDSKINEKCAKCQNDIVYRRSSYFGIKTYYKICNFCGYYQVIPKEVWKEVINRTKPVKPQERAE
ncbi:MAG: hypothetical protein COT43_02395 [Candidatus Marinimicrobia bacterium CG08_land_8_20_14_0_20_45_22]|nr:MAG: hypothetical protein COT43_02395 [Candidatus Marinimicrobia bacterium CG08_land_8_20_14_0_20_45_22]